MTDPTLPEIIPSPSIEGSVRTHALNLLEEIFTAHHGYILDRGTSFFETLAEIDAEIASLRYSPHCGTLAAQVNHTRFYLDVVLRAMRDGDNTPADWDSSWEIEAVNEEGWAALLAGLRASYEAVAAHIGTRETWDDSAVGDAMALVAHSAHHLGEIRQALAVIPLLRPGFGDQSIG